MILPDSPAPRRAAPPRRRRKWCRCSWFARTVPDW